MIKQVLFVVLFASFILVSCQTSQLTPETEYRAPGVTITISPTETILPAATDSPTQIPTLAPSPTMDMRVIDTQPRLIILTEEEIDAYYDYGMYGSVPNYREYGNVVNPYANLSCKLGYEEAVEFLDTTGLVTGWTTQYVRANINPYEDTGLPSHFEFFVLSFRTVEGPKTFMEEWDTPCEFDFYEYLADLTLGEKATFCQYESWMQNGELSHIRYRIAVRYKNVFLGMKVEEHPDRQLDLENVFFITDLQLQKIAALPLEDSVTLAQDFTPGEGCAIPPTPEESAGRGNSQAAGYCIAKRVYGVQVCWGMCLPECSGVTPEGEIVGLEGCIPCTLKEGPSIGSGIIITVDPDGRKETP